jgi:hypothetical protein
VGVGVGVVALLGTILYIAKKNNMKNVNKQLEYK